jgi:hypothetical protein
LIIRFSLLLVCGAIVSFLLAIVLDQLSITNLAVQATELGAITLLCAFSLIALSGLMLAGKLSVTAFCEYFSGRQRMERKLLFYTGRRNRLNQIFQFKKARLLYVNQQKRKHLLTKDDRKSAKP